MQSYNFDLGIWFNHMDEVMAPYLSTAGVTRQAVLHPKYFYAVFALCHPTSVEVAGGQFSLPYNYNSNAVSAWMTGAREMHQRRSNVCDENKQMEWKGQEGVVEGRLPISIISPV
jgi:hypothetical protein